MDNASDPRRRGSEESPKEVNICNISLGLDYLTLVSEAALHGLLGSHVIDAASAHGDDVSCSMTCHVDSQRSAQALQTTDNDVRSVSAKAQSGSRWPDRNLYISLFSIGDDDLADVSTAADVRERIWHSIKPKCRDWVDRLDVAAFNQDENLVQKSGWMECQKISSLESPSFTYKSTYLSINGSLMSWVYEKSIALNDALRSNGSIDNSLRSTISFFPISTMIPPSAMIRHEASSSSPVRELIMTSMPRSLVAAMISLAKFVLREENMRLRGIP